MNDPNWNYAKSKQKENENFLIFCKKNKIKLQCLEVKHKNSMVRVFFPLFF